MTRITGLKDILFLSFILSIIGLTIAFFWKAVRTGYRKAMIENLQNHFKFQQSSPRMLDTSETIELEPFPQPKTGQKPHIGMYKVHMLSPSTAQYGKQNAVYIPTREGIPASALPDISMKDPWAFNEIVAAQKPEIENCERSATGLFQDCGVPSANSLCY